MQFGKMFFAALLALVVAFFLLIIALIAVAGAAAAGDKSPPVSPGSILYLRMDTPFIEHFDGDQLDLGSLVLPLGSNMNKIGLYEFTEKIRQAQQDPRISGIYLEMVGQAPGGWATLQAARKALEEFRNSGKFIYTWSPYYSEATYYLASVADSIYMAPQGAVEWNGLAVSPYFFLGLFEKIGIQPEIYRSGVYKSAGETFSAKKLSDENRRQTEAYLQVFWQEFTSAVSLSRKIAPHRLDSLASELFEGSGRNVLAAGLVDRLCDETEVGFALRRAAGQQEGQKLKYVAYSDWFKVQKTRSGKSDGKLAVVFAEGEIVPGKGAPDQIGMERMTGLLRKMRKDPSIKAVVLRINSPGGDALSSDLIALEIMRLKASKPVVVSMGDIAASGGYYMAAPATRIFANPHTLTGSIGVVLLQFSAKTLLTEKLGITTDEVKTHPYANLGSPDRSVTDQERAYIQRGVDRTYGRFLQVVRDGRGFRDTLEVDRIAQGRLWAGKDAVQAGLVDELGGLQDALAFAASEAGLRTYEVATYPQRLGPVEELLRSFSGQKAALTPFVPGHPLFQDWQSLLELQQAFPAPGTYARMEFVPVIR